VSALAVACATERQDLLEMLAQAEAEPPTESPQV